MCAPPARATKEYKMFSSTRWRFHEIPLVILLVAMPLVICQLVSLFSTSTRSAVGQGLSLSLGVVEVTLPSTIE